MKWWCLSGSAVCVVSMALAGPAQPSGRTEAVQIAQAAARYLKAHGKDEMIKRINERDPRFNKGELYVAMRDLNGITLAHPTLALIGKNLLDVPDADGKLFRREMRDVANSTGSGWVDYKFRNPVSGRVEDKSTFVLRAGDVALEAGIYKR